MPVSSSDAVRAIRERAARRTPCPRFRRPPASARAGCLRARSPAAPARGTRERCAGRRRPRAAEPERAERVVHDRDERLVHVALAPVAPGQPVADVRAAALLAEREQRGVPDRPVVRRSGEAPAQSGLRGKEGLCAFDGGHGFGNVAHGQLSSSAWPPGRSPSRTPRARRGRPPRAARGARSGARERRKGSSWRRRVTHARSERHS